MEADKDTKPERKKKRKMRILKWVLLGVAVLIVLVVFVVPAFVSSEMGRKIILGKINDSIEGKVDFGELSMGWWKGVKIKDFSFSDEAGQTLVNVSGIATKPRYGGLLLGSLSFGETRVDKPRVEINLKERQPARVAPGEKAPQAGLPIKEIELLVIDGGVKITAAKAGSAEFSKINSRVNLRPPGEQTDFDVDVTVVDEGKGAKVHADGRIRPDRKSGWSLKGTSGDFVVEVNDLELESLGPIFALGGVDIEAKGRISSNIKSTIKDGRIEDLSGTLKGGDVDITGQALKGDRLKSDALDVRVKLRTEKELINISELKVDSDWVDAEVNGVVPTSFASMAELVRADSAYSLAGSFECDLAAGLSQMPRTLGVKEGMKVTSGRLSGRVQTVSKEGKKGIYGSGLLVDLGGVVGGKRIGLSEPVTAEALITSDETGVAFDKLDVSASFARVRCTGSSKLLKYDGSADLERLQSELGQFVEIGQYKMAGELFSKGEVSGDRNRILAAGSAQVKELQLISPEGVSAFEPEANIEFSVVVEPNKGIVDVDSAKVSASVGQVGIRDSVIGWSKKAERPLKLAVSANDVDLEKLRPFAVLFASFPKRVQVAGTAKSEVSLSFQKDTFYISTDSTRIENLKFSSPGKKPFDQNDVSVVADVEVNPAEKTFAVKRLEVVSPQIKIRKCEISKVSKEGKSKLEGRVDCEYDWAVVGAAAAPYLPAGLKLEGERKETVSFSSEYAAGQTGELTANLSANAKLGFESAEYMGLHFGPTETVIEAQKGLLTLSPFTTKVNDGEFSFAAKANFREKPPLLQIPKPIEIAKDIEINDETTRSLLMYLNPIFANAVDVSGKVSFSCEQLAIPLGAARREQIQIIGTVSGDDIRLSVSDLLGQLLSVSGLSFTGQDIRVRPTRFILWDGFLRYDDMQIDVGDNPINFKGVIGLDKSLNMTVTLPYTLDGKTVRVGEDAAGKRISVPLRGTIDKPELDLGKLLEQQLKDQLEEQLRKKIFEGLDELLK